MNKILIFLWIINLNFCTESTAITEVSLNNYRDPSKCWTNDEGNFFALVALTQIGSERFPVFISQKCDVSGHIDDIFTIVTNPTPINISFGRVKNTEERIQFLNITDNVIRPRTGASYESELYKVEAKITVGYEKDQFVIYDVSKIIKFESIGMNFLQYINLDRRQRIKIRST